MTIFQPITLEWKGRDHTIPAERIMGAIAAIEEVITLPEIALAVQTRKVPTARTAMAYAALLRYIGEDVSSEEVYATLFGDKGQMRTLGTIQTLLMMMVPRDIKVTEEDKKAQGKEQPAA